MPHNCITCWKTATSEKPHDCAFGLYECNETLKLQIVTQASSFIQTITEKDAKISSVKETITEKDAQIHKQKE
jgi:hypothetical protein